MKKIILLTIILYCFQQPLVAQTGIEEINPEVETLSLIAIADSIYNWSFYNPETTWDTYPYQKIINTHDANNNLTNQLQQRNNGITWRNDLQTIYIYDVNNNQTSKLMQRWTNSAWKDSIFYTYTYDANHNMTSSIKQERMDSALENTSKVIYSYDVGNKKTSMLLQWWNDSVWENSDMFTYIYDLNNNETSSLRQYWNITYSYWGDYELVTSTYDVNDNLTSILVQTWIWNDSIWDNDYLLTYDYDMNNNRTDYLSQTWNGSAWTNAFQRSYTYDNDNNRINFIDQYWDNNSWINNVLFTFTYDLNSFLESIARRGYEAHGVMFNYGDSTHYYFHTETGIEEANNSANFFLYPNPATTTLTIETDNQIPVTDYRLQIYNTQGQLVFTSIFDIQHSTFDISTFPSGLYYLSLQSEEGVAVKRFEVIR